ncbi:MAG: Cys-tRNA(Pro) deacylase [Clostridia bacterium]|jgi:Cys-tRNA(Pro)/Cys-tRNA(Cys) deacylase|nr:Cys-tRNA(Pro) deacylase [Clostridia bacterium]
MEKTNALRILAGKKIACTAYSYDSEDGKIDGLSVAQKIGKDPELVYKTLVTQGNSRSIYVFIVPVADELDLKKAAQAAGEKSVEMISAKDILPLTGYVRGGCSPVGMKKSYRTFLEQSAKDLTNIVVSAGKIGLQMELAVLDLLKATNGRLADIRK